MHRGVLSGKALLSVSISWALLILGFFVVAPSFAQDRVGVVDLERVVNESAAGKRALKSFQELQERTQLEVEKRRQEVIQKEQSLQEQQRDFEARRAILREEEQRRKAEDLMRLAREVRRMQEDLRRFVEDQRAELVDRRQKLMENILLEVREVVRNVGRKGGLTLVLDKRLLIYYDASKVDLTDQIIRIYDQQKQ